MPSRSLQSEGIELLSGDSYGSDEYFDLHDASEHRHASGSVSFPNRRFFTPIRAFLSQFNPFREGFRLSARTPKLQRKSRAIHGSSRRISRLSRRCCFLLNLTIVILVTLISYSAIFQPSYTSPPAHYQTLRRQVEGSKNGGYGRANPENEKIFIAASIYDKDGSLLAGAWGESVLKLLDILGNTNVFLSIYENESGDAAQTAQIGFERKVQCPHKIVYDKEFSMDDVDKITLPDGSARTKRVAYLAEVRNKALLPLMDAQGKVIYDKLLFLNDVIFDPVEAAQLLLSTNLDARGHTSYHAACAVDFINPFKFYDTYATRDLQGYSMGVPFFPWFTTAGEGVSRRDVLAGRDAVRVRSCWGGMVAFDAKPFQKTQPLRFRATTDTYWDASECCLIHADLMQAGPIDQDGSEIGVYMNPFVRVAYSKGTLSWLHYTRRFERLFGIPHNIVNHIVGLPWFNPRRIEEPGVETQEKVWVSNNGTKLGGSFQIQTRKATGDGFCGQRMLQLIKETPRNGEKNWETMPVPPG